MSEDRVDRDQGAMRGYEVVRYDPSGQDLIDKEDIEAVRMKAFLAGQPVPAVPALPGVLPQPGFPASPSNGKVVAKQSASLDKFLAAVKPRSSHQVPAQGSAVAHNPALKAAGAVFDSTVLNRGLPKTPTLASEDTPVGPQGPLPNSILARMQQQQATVGSQSLPEKTSFSDKLSELEDPASVLEKIRKNPPRKGVIVATTSVGDFYYKPLGFRVMEDLVALLFSGEDEITYTPRRGMLLYCTLRTERGLELYGLYYSGIKLPSMYANEDHQILVFHRTDVQLLDSSLSQSLAEKSEKQVSVEVNDLTLAIKQVLDYTNDGDEEFFEELSQDGTPDGLD